MSGHFFVLLAVLQLSHTTVWTNAATNNYFHYRPTFQLYYTTNRFISLSIKYQKTS